MAENKDTSGLERVAELLRGGVYVDMDIRKLKSKDNVRDPATLNLPSLILGFKTRRWLADSILTVSHRANGEDVTLRGNRRTLAAQELWRTDPDAFKRAFGESGMVRVHYFEGLSRDDEILIRGDHSKELNTKELTEWELFLAVRQFVKVGNVTEAGIALMMGRYKEDKEGNKQPDRSFIQKRVQLATLPAFVQNEFKQLWSDGGKNKTLARINMIPTFAAAIGADTKADPSGMGTHPITNEPLEFSAGGGPEFAKCWKINMVPDSVEAKEQEEAEEKGKPKPIITHNDLSGRVNSFESAIMQLICRAICGEQSHTSLAELDSRLIQLESDQRDLTAIGKHIGPNGLQQLLSDARNADSNIGPKEGANVNGINDGTQPEQVTETQPESNVATLTATETQPEQVTETQPEQVTRRTKRTKA